MTAVKVEPADRSNVPDARGDTISRAGEPLSEAARIALLPLSRFLTAEEERYIDNQMEHIYAQRPDLAANDLFVETTRGICRYNIDAFARILAGSEPAKEVADVRPSAFTSGEMMSRSGISLLELMEVYRRGQALLLQDFLAQAVGELEPAAPYNEVLHHCMICWGVYVDATLSNTVEGFLSDQERHRTHFRARRIRAAEAVLQGKLTDVDEASVELGYDLRTHHLGFAFQHLPGAQQNDFEAGVERFADQVTRVFGARRSLVIPIGSRQMWAWFSAGEPHDMAGVTSLRRHAEDLDLRVSMGKPGWGLPGFITTNRQARYTGLAVENFPNPAVLTTYPEIAAVSLIKVDRNQILTFVQDQLGGLASKDRRMAELRHTVAVFLAEGRNARRAAEVLNTHKNTVHYRLTRAEEIRRRPILDDTLELELALRLVTHYGDWTLAD